MAELLRKHRVYAHPNPNPNPDPRPNSSFEPDPSPQYSRNSSKGRSWKQKKEGPHVSGLKKEEEEEEGEEQIIRKAAAILLSRAWPSLSLDLCECCSASLNSRLITMASSSSFMGKVTLPVEFNRNHNISNPVVVEETDDNVTSFASPGTCDDVQNTSFQPEIGLKPDVDSEEQLGRKVMVSRHEDDGKTDLIIKMALNAIGTSPHPRTWSMARNSKIIEKPEVVRTRSLDSADSARMQKVTRKKDYCVMERIHGRNINILEGLELHRGVLDELEQQELVKFIYRLQELGRNEKLRRRTYSEPRKWMRGKGRVTIQFGCCYNYAVDKDGNPPGIIRDEEVDEIPEQLRMVIKRLVRWRVLPSSCIPDSCIVNIYDEGDCIPPHIDHHDFLRPFCTLSLVSECNIVFGSNLKIVGPGDFQGSISIPLPTGSVFILNGNGADVAKHAVPAVPTKRISITFRKMDPAKAPHSFRPDPELVSIIEPKMDKRRSPHNYSAPYIENEAERTTRISNVAGFSSDADFPALGTPLRGGRSHYSRS